MFRVILSLIAGVGQDGLTENSAALVRR